MTEAAATKLDVVLFPWLAFGHMIPYLELAKRLAARGHAVTFLSTPRNLARLPPVPGLPEGAESTADVPPEKNELIKKAADGLAAPFAAFLSDAVAGGRRRPDWVVHDFCHHAIPPIAEAHGVPCAAFLIVQAATIAFLGPRWAHAAHPRTAPEDFAAPPVWCRPALPPAVAYRRHEAGWAVGAFRPNASGVSDMDRTWEIIERTRFTIYRSCEEMEPGLFALLTDLFRKPTISAGVLLKPEPDLADGGGESSRSGARSEVVQWLDSQPPKSVIYVALGSEAPLTANNLHELALGLELAGVRFLWAFRKPSGMSSAPGTGAAGELLPTGFEQRTRGRGLVWSGWVPQVAVLAHAAVGAFLTHCGWGSTIESLVFGRPMVLLPFIVDQGLIARTMAERGVGVEVARDDGDGSFGRDGVAEAVRRVMVEEDGKVFVSNAEKMKEVLGDQRRQDQYMDEVVRCLVRYKHDNC
ncbi:unnamed protein product [Urochloa decumbens]|uniref:Glycosyltransferase n=1 Tax=Urochloa decumbens TaxID=240449 RepID=A0ABC8Y827_9POAL